MLEITERICAGEAEEEDIVLLERLAEGIAATSLCGLGQTAPNPVKTTLRYFRDEYLAHIREKRCPAFVCKELIAYHIDPEKCQACMICLRKCPADAVIGAKKQIHVIDQEKCTKCGTCFEVCPSRFSAVRRISGEPVPAPISQEARTIVRKSEG
jgi:NADH-quinone oxidoreductase subunit F